MSKDQKKTKEPEEKPKKQIRPRRYLYRIADILRIRKQLVAVVSLEFLKETPTGPRFDRFVDLFHEALPGELHRPTLEDSLRHLAGVRLTAQRIDDVCWRMAGNLQRLAQRWSVPKWHSQRMPEWVPVQIMACRRSKNQRGKIGATFTFRIMAGTPCTLSMYKWWSMEQCRFYAVGLGFHKPPRRDVIHVVRPFSAPEQFVSLRMYVLLEPELCNDGPGFSVPAFPHSLREWNLEIIKKRLRVDLGYTCPRGFAQTFPCHLCPTGYQKCAAATHRKDWVQKTCPGCANQAAWFDAESTGQLCIDCIVKQMYKER